MFSAFEPEEIVALLSALVFQEKSADSDPLLTPRLEEVSLRAKIILLAKLTANAGCANTREAI